MTTIFLICAVFGGTILALQLVLTFVGFGHSEFDVADDIPDSFDTALATDAFDGHHEVGDPHGSTSMFGVLSIRTLTAAIAFFGIAGMTAQAAGAPVLYQVFVAGLAGMGALYGVYYLLQSVYRLAQSGTLHISNAVGRTATVYVPIPGGRQGQGKVQVEIQNRLEEFAAVTLAHEKLKTGAKVIVVGVIGDSQLDVEPLREAKKIA